MFFELQNIITLDEVDSTNNYAAKLIRMTDAQDRTVISALNQSAGKGQRGAIWQSDPGKNLLLSIILRPTSFSIENQFYLNKLISLAVRKFLAETTASDTYIKWPNDILVADKKIAGMLLECGWNGKSLQYAIAGIGINLNQENFNIHNATSVLNITKETTNREKALEDLLKCIDHYYLMLLAGHWKALDNDYRHYLYRLNVKSDFVVKDHHTTGIIQGVTGDGHLLLKLPTEEILKLDLKEVKMLY